MLDSIVKPEGHSREHDERQDRYAEAIGPGVSTQLDDARRAGPSTFVGQTVKNLIGSVRLKGAPLIGYWSLAETPQSDSRHVTQ